MEGRRVRRWIFGVVALVVVLLLAVVIASALVVGLGASGDARDGRAAFDEGRGALSSGDGAAARAAFERAGDAFASGAERFDSLLGAPVRIVPVAGDHTETARAIMRAGELSARAGQTAARALDPAPAGGWGLERGTVNLEAAETAGRILREAVSFGERALGGLESAPSGWLIEPLASALHDTRFRVAEALDGLTKARDGLERVPSLFARGGTKRYLVALTIPAELRGTGGVISHMLVVEASNGRLSVVPGSDRSVDALPAPEAAGASPPPWFLEAYERYGVTRVLRNVNISTDLSVSGGLIASAAAAELGPIDGVILLTPHALQALLEVTQAVGVEAWPDLVSAENVAEIVQHDMFVRYEGDPERRAVLQGQLLTSVFERVLSTDIRLTSLGRLGRVAAAGDFQLYSTRSQDQLSLSQLGVAGAVDRPVDATDVLGVVTSNAVGNKIDWHLRREVVYRVMLDPEGLSATTELVASLVNRAPAAGEPPEVIRSVQPAVADGTNRQIVLILRPATDELTSLQSGDRSEAVVRAPEAGLAAYHTGVVVPPGQRLRVTARSTVPGVVASEGARLVYRLHVLRQPVPHADFYDVRIEAPVGWSVQGTTTFVGPLESDLMMEVALRRTLRSRLVDTVVLRPWRAVSDFVSSLV